MKADFDIASNQYDTLFTFSNIGKAQRQRVFKYINPLLIKEGKHSILELNCGTGADAITFGNLGHNVIATDISEGMIQAAKAKAPYKNVTFKVQDINTLESHSFDQKFDIIFSNFGGLNCLSKTELSSFLKKSTELLNPNGRLILIIMPKHCLWEQLYFRLKGNVKKAKRRNTSRSVIANVDGIHVNTWYFDPNEIIKFTALHYTVSNLKPIGLTIPPSYLEHSFVSKKSILKVLNGLENIISKSWLSKYADHFLIELIKKP